MAGRRAQGRDAAGVVDLVDGVDWVDEVDGGSVHFWLGYIFLNADLGKKQ
jgi:hypothetical protein